MNWIINTSGCTTVEDWLDDDFIDVMECLVLLDNLDEL